MGVITEEIYQALKDSHREMKNYRFKAKNAERVAYWESQIKITEELIDQYEKQLASSDDITDSVNGSSDESSVSEES